MRFRLDAAAAASMRIERRDRVAIALSTARLGCATGVK